MKKILSAILALVSIGIIIAGCGGSAASNMGPKEVLVSFFEKLSKKDIDGATKLATKDSKSTMDMMKKGLEMAEKMKDEMKDAEKKDPTEEFRDLEIGDAKINGDMATVPVKNKKKDTDIEFPLKKEDGAWKVDFSMTTLMKMGMDEKNKRENAGQQDYKDLTGEDSIAMQKGLEALDTTMKKLDPKKLEETMKQLKKLEDQQK